MQPFRGYTAKSKWWTVNSLAEMPLQRIISLAVDHGWLYATNAVSLFMQACSLHMHVCWRECMHMHKHRHTQAWTLAQRNTQIWSACTQCFEPKLFLLEAYSEIYGINNLNSIIFSPLAFKIMHAWLCVWMKFCMYICLVISVYKTCCVTWFHAISIF